MVNLLKFAVSTLHVWENSGSCAFPRASFDVFSLGTFTFGHDHYCFALADVSTQLDMPDGYRHNVWPLSVMVELIACAVILGYLWSALLGDRELRLELYFPSCIGRALSELRTHSNVEVVSVRGGDLDVVERASHVFYEIGTLPFLKKVSIDNYYQFPIQALTTLLRGLENKQVKSCLESGPHRVHQRSSCSKLLALELHVEELRGNQLQLNHLCRSMEGRGFIALRNLKLCFWRQTELAQTMRNERALASILAALNHHPSLQELEIRSPMGPAPMQPEKLQEGASAADPKCKHTDLPSPVIDNLIALVQKNMSLKRLSTTFWGRHNPGHERGDQDSWYIAPLAKAISHPTFNTASNLQSLDLVMSPVPEEGPTFLKSLGALETMVRSNYNISELFVGGPGNDDDPLEDYDDAYDYNNMLNHRTMGISHPPDVSQHLDCCHLYVKLNRLGRKRLLCDPNTSRDDWIPAILENKDDVSITFCWISMCPEVLP